jgi:chromosome segregation ATPase
MPNFATSAEAEDELRKFLAKLRKRQAHREKPVADRPDLSERLTAVSRKTELLAAEDEKIARLRASSEGQKLADDKEYGALLANIEESKRRISELKRKIAGGDATAKEAQKSMDKANRDLENAISRLKQIQNEERRQSELAKRTREELLTLEEEFITREKEEALLSERSRPVLAQDAELKKLRAILEQKNSLIHQKQVNIARILADSDQLESKLEEEVGRVRNEAEKSSDSEVLSFPPRREFHDSKIPPFRHRQPKSSSSDSDDAKKDTSYSGHLSELASSDSKNSSPLKSNPYRSPKSRHEDQLALANDDDSDHSVQELLRTTEHLLRGSPSRHKPSPDISDVYAAAQKAISMPVKSSKAVRDKVERRTVQWN